MVTAESVKLKIQNLIARANTATGKEDKDLTLAVNTLIEGYGQGECDGIHVIEVEELPEVGETGVVYKLVKKDLLGISIKSEEGLTHPNAYGLLLYALAGLVLPDEAYSYIKEADIDNFIPGTIYYVENENSIYSYSEDKGWEIQVVNGVITSPDQLSSVAPGTYAWIGNEYEYYEYIIEDFELVTFKTDQFQHLSSIMPIVSVSTRPVVSGGTGIIYYIEDEDAFLIYDSDTGEWKDFTLTENEDLNIIDNISQITEEGDYIVRSGKFRKYLHPTGTKTITEAGIYNVEELTAINVAYDSIHGAWKLDNTITGLADVTTYSVNFTTVHENNVIKCIGMHFIIDLSDGNELYYVLEDGSEIQVYGIGGWQTQGTNQSNYQYVDFGEERQNVPKHFADFIRKGTPIYDLLVEVETEEAMNALLEVAEEGTVYRYTGPTTEDYENGALYIVYLSMVSFTIDGADHQGEEDMTWAEWCASEYNTISCVNAGAEELIYNSDNTKQLMLNDVAVYGKDTLTSGAAYVFITIPVEEPSTEEPNDYGTTVVVNQYSEEDNDYGTTVVIGEEDEVNLITFTLNGTEYQAEENMTWGQWVESEYNTTEMLVNGTGTIYDPSNGTYGAYVQYNGEDVNSSNAIIADAQYTFRVGSGAD